MTDQAAATRSTASQGWRSGTVGFGLCVGAGTLSALGDTMQAFALNWEATAYGADVAGLVATAGVLPRAFLMLLGGSVADRYGIRRVMIICDALMAVAVAVALAILFLAEQPLGVIIGLAVVGGAISAFYLPASGGFVRLFIPDERLPVILPRVSGIQQIARLIGPALGALVVVGFGLAGALGINLITFLVILLVLIMIRPPQDLSAPPAAGPDGPAGEVAAGHVLAGVRQAWRTPGMTPALISVALVAGSVLPVLYLGVPLLAREQHWGAPAAGWIESAWIVGSLSITVIMARYGAHRRMGLMIMVGPLDAAVGAALIAIAPNVQVGVAGSVLMGIGTVIFTGHLAPLYLAWTPPELTARFQALFGIVQAVPMALVSAPYGMLADALGARIALAAAAVVALAATGVVLSSRRLLTATRPNV